MKFFSNFPLTLSSFSESENVLNKANENRDSNKKTPWTLSLSFYMGPQDLTSASCLEAGSCLPLGGLSAWGISGGIDTAAVEEETFSETRPVVLVYFPLDTLALFHDEAAGASTAASIAVALGAAQALAKEASLDYDSANVRLAFFAGQAEHLGQLGSKRFLHDVEHFDCATYVKSDESIRGRPFCASPLRTDLAFRELKDFFFPTDVADYQRVRVIGLDKLVGTKVFSRSHVGDDSTLRWMEDVFESVASSEGYDIEFQKGDSTLPAYGMGAFSKLDPDKASSLVLSGYDGTLDLPYFGSKYDSIDTLDSARLAETAELLARSLYAFLNDWDMTNPAATAAAIIPTTLRVNATYVDSIIRCVMVSPACPEFASALNAPMDFLGTNPINLFPGVFRQPYRTTRVVNDVIKHGWGISPSVLEVVIRNSLAYYLSNVDPDQVDEDGGPVSCDSYAKCAEELGLGYECIHGLCLRSNAWFHDALSPALIAPGDPGSEEGSMPGTGRSGYRIDESVPISKDLPLPVGDAVRTEPYWSASIGAKLYRRDKDYVGGIVLGVGLFMVVLSYFGSMKLISFLDTYYKVP